MVYQKFNLAPHQLIVISFLILILLGTGLLMLPISSKTSSVLPMVDALFTATSAVCVTGLVVVDTGSYFSLFGQFIIIILIQLGGLGVMTLVTGGMLFAGKRMGLSQRVVMHESVKQFSLLGMLDVAKSVIITTLVIEAVGGTLLGIYWYFDYGLQGIYYGYWHAISAFCNAGFDLFGNFSSLARYSDHWIVNLIIAGLIILGGLGFPVLSNIWFNRDLRLQSLHSKVVLLATFILITLGTIGIYLLEYQGDILNGKGVSEQVLVPFFLSVSSRTAGFSTVDIGLLNNSTLLFVIMLMFIGAAPGSTGGGIKCSTASIVLLASIATLRGNKKVSLFYRSISPDTVHISYSIFVLSSLLILIFSAIVSFIDHFSFLTSLFEVTSAFGTVGLTTGITPSLSSISKICLIFMMFIGRVGLLTLATAWVLQKNNNVEYPEGKIIVG